MYDLRVSFEIDNSDLEVSFQIEDKLHHDL